MKFTARNLKSFCYTKSGTKCWLWIGANNGRGYGIATISQQKIYMHRLSWELFNGPIPKGMCVCHHCDTPNCLNPKHLFLGTCSDNRMDCLSKGRWPGHRFQGERSPLAKLKNKDAAAIRVAYMTGLLSQRAIAKTYGVSQATIGNVLAGKTYLERG